VPARSAGRSPGGGAPRRRGRRSRPGHAFYLKRRRGRRSRPCQQGPRPLQTGTRGARPGQCLILFLIKLNADVNGGLSPPFGSVGGSAPRRLFSFPKIGTYRIYHEKVSLIRFQDISLMICLIDG
jgi:hypothetical protein